MSTASIVKESVKSHTTNVIIVISYITNRVLMDFMTYQSSVKYSDILELEIADGLKELLMDYGFTRRRI